MTFYLHNFTKFMKKVITYISITLLSFLFKAFAEFTVYDSPKASISSGSLRATKNGILAGDDANYSSTTLSLYRDNVGNLNFKPQAMPGYRISDLGEDDNFYYATSTNILWNQIGLFKISKDFKTQTNIGLKATLRKLLVYKDKVYVGGTVHGCYVVNKDGTGLTQILGDGYYGPFIDDIKGNSKNIFVLSRGLLYKVEYESNNKSLVPISYRPYYIEADDERIYSATSNQFFYINPDTGEITNLKTFPNQIVLLKKYKNFIVIAETSSYYTTFWFSNDKGLNFYKSKTLIPAVNQLKNLEIIGDKDLTLYLSLNNIGVIKAKLTFDFEEPKLFASPFTLFNSTDLLDKITSYFDHRYPFLGNLIEESKYSNTTLNFQGKELPQPYLYYSSHDGIDFGLPLNTPILAAESGVASYFYQDKGLGNAILISHPNGYITIYGHMSSEDLITKTQINVIKGQKIGKVGMSGNTNGPHLHFTTYNGPKVLNNKVDPFGWQGNFTDPWSAPSKYLWDVKPESLISQISLNEKNEITYQNVIFSSNTHAFSEPQNLSIYKSSPVFDSLNYLYKLNTSYSFGFTDFLGNKTEIENVLRYPGFDDFKDEKNYSIWKVTENGNEKLETIFNPLNKTLETKTNFNSDYLILKNNYKKISSTSTFNIKR